MCYTLVTTGTMLTGAMLCHILLLDTLQPWNHRFYSIRIQLMSLLFSKEGKALVKRCFQVAILWKI